MNQGSNVFESFLLKILLFLWDVLTVEQD